MSKVYVIFLKSGKVLTWADGEVKYWEDLTPSMKEYCKKFDKRIFLDESVQDDMDRFVQETA